MYYGYEIRGILHTYERKKKDGEVISREESTYYAEMKVDGKMNRSKLTLYADKDRQTKLKEIVLDTRLNKRMVVEPI